MAIQVRRGPYSQFDPTKMQPGEIACVTSGDPGSSDGRAVYMCFASGTVKRMATTNDMAEYLADMTEDTISTLTTSINAAIATANTSAENADTKAAAANTATELANAATQAAQQATQTMNNLIAAVGDISALAVPLMSPVLRGGAMLGDGLVVDDGYLKAAARLEYEVVNGIEMVTLVTEE